MPFERLAASRAPDAPTARQSGLAPENLTIGRFLCIFGNELCKVSGQAGTHGEAKVGKLAAKQGQEPLFTKKVYSIFVFCDHVAVRDHLERAAGFCSNFCNCGRA